MIFKPTICSEVKIQEMKRGRLTLSFSYRLSTDPFRGKKTGFHKPLLFLFLGKNDGAFFQLTLLLDSSMADSNALSFSFFRNPCRKGERELQPKNQPCTNVR